MRCWACACGQLERADLSAWEGREVEIRFMIAGGHRGSEAWLDADDAGHNYFEVCLSCLRQPCQAAKPYLGVKSGEAMEFTTSALTVIQKIRTWYFGSRLS